MNRCPRCGNYVLCRDYSASSERYYCLNCGAKFDNSAPQNTKDELYMLNELLKKEQQFRTYDKIDYMLGVSLVSVFHALYEDGIYVWDAGEIIHVNHTELSLHCNDRLFLWETPYGPKVLSRIGVTWAFEKKDLENL